MQRNRQLLAPSWGASSAESYAIVCPEESPKSCISSSVTFSYTLLMICSVPSFVLLQDFYGHLLHSCFFLCASCGRFTAVCKVLNAPHFKWASENGFSLLLSAATWLVLLLGMALLHSSGTNLRQP